MIKKILAAVLAFVLVLICVPAAASAESVYAPGDVVKTETQPAEEIPENCFWLRGSDTRGELVCENTEEGHVHTDECYEKTEPYTVWILKREPMASLKVSAVLSGLPEDFSPDGLSAKVEGAYGFEQTVPLSREDSLQTAVSLPEGDYKISLIIPETEGYAVKDDPESAEIHLEPGEEKELEFTAEFEKTLPFSLSLSFAGDSALTAEDFPEGIKVSVKASSDEDSRSYSSVLNADNSWSSVFSLPAGTYVIGAELQRDYYKTNENIQGHSFEIKEAPCSFEGSVSYSPGRGSLSVTNNITYFDIDKKAAVENPKTGLETSEYSYEITIGEEVRTENFTAGETKSYSDIPYLTSGTVKLTGKGKFSAENREAAFTVGENDKTCAGGDAGIARLTFNSVYYYSFPEKPFTALVLNTDADTGDSISGGNFTVYSDEALLKSAGTATGSSGGSLGFILQDFGTYYIKQTRAPGGYDINPRVFTVEISPSYSIDEADGKNIIRQTANIKIEGLEKNSSGSYIFANKKSSPVDVSVNVRFINDEKLKRPESAEIALYRNGSLVEKLSLSDKNNWSHVWKQLPGGYKYSVDETVIPEGYYKSVYSESNRFTITNSGSPSPATGDGNSVLFWAALGTFSLLSGSVILHHVLKRRKTLS